MQGSEFSGGEIEMLDRGVYWARTLSPRNHPIAYAVDSNHRKIRSFEVTHPSRTQMALVTLWDILDKEDPTAEGRRAGMHLILPTTEHRSMVEAYDPYAMPPLPGVWRQRG